MKVLKSNNFDVRSAFQKLNNLQDERQNLQDEWHSLSAGKILTKQISSGCRILQVSCNLTLLTN